jgi:crossover junction endodeoxyribonuclease RuvC
VRAVAVDVVRTPPEAEVADRLGAVADAVEAWIVEHRPDVVAVERVFAQHNVRTVRVVALIAGRAGLPVAFHTPSEVKAAVTGSGRADKGQVTAMVTRVLALETAPRPADAADALALAICHCWRAPMMARMAEAEARAAEATKRHRARLEAAQKATQKATQKAGR